MFVASVIDGGRGAAQRGRRPAGVAHEGLLL